MKKNKPAPDTGTIFENLKAKYDGQKIDVIEANASGAAATSLAARKEFIEALWYLQKTQRFRENADYKASTFERYLRDRFNITRAKYESERGIVFNHLPHAEALGIGKVEQVLKTLGRKDGGKALDDALRAARPLTAINQKIEKIIKQKTPPPAAPSSPGLYTESEVERLKTELRDANREIADLHAQIARLKRTVKEKDALIVALQSGDLRDHHKRVADLLTDYRPAPRPNTI
jgi:hypothetical protein